MSLTPNGLTVNALTFDCLPVRLPAHSHRIKKQHHRAASAFLAKHGGVPPARGSNPGEDGGGDRQASVTSVREEAPFTGVPGALQQRKFMSLIDTKQPQHPLLMAQHVGGEEEDEEAVVGVDESDGMGSEDIEPECYHEIHAIPLLDPVLDKQARRMGRGKGGSWGNAGQQRTGHGWVCVSSLGRDGAGSDGQPGSFWCV